VTVRGPERSLWRVMFSPILPVHGQKLLLMAERVDSAFTATCRKEQPPPASRPAETSAGQRARRAVAGRRRCLARPPLPSARHVVPELVLDWPSTSLAAPPPGRSYRSKTKPPPPRQSSPSHARSSLLPAPHRPPSFVTRPSTRWLSCQRTLRPCLASTLLLLLAPEQQLRLSPRVWPIAPTRPPAHHIAALAPRPTAPRSATLRSRACAPRVVSLFDRQVPPPRAASGAINSRAAASHQTIVGNAAARPSRGVMGAAVAGSHGYDRGHGAMG
jgi:hypothetical protein